ncbi:MAG TPA: helix-hairpin-helix domain-containing protein [Gemmatimonadaceae bacterium]|jgi:competence protein ComEA|nr:helix-hairpin-helix domain-containing protein [Gemmatimonadaceae bacterium]
MPTPAERKALLFFSIVLVLGASGRAIRAFHGSSPADAKARSALESQIKAADSARKSGRRKSKRDKAKKEPPAPKGPVDLDVASVEDIVALRHVGPALARRIVADRDSFGPFGSLEGLRRVRGIGPSMVEKLDSAVTFSGVPRPTNTVIPRPSEVPKARRKPHRRDPRP